MDNPALENFFSTYRAGIIGQHQTFESPFGKKKIIYGDWTASGRAYAPIEDCIQKKFMPFLANTHTQTSITGTMMSTAYRQAKDIVKRHVHANQNDVLIFCGSGTTSAVNKLQRILGLRIPEKIMDYIKKQSGPPGIQEKQADPSQVNKLLTDHLRLDETLRPVVFITHMEHHSNQTSWLETIATVEIIGRHKNGNVDLKHFRELLEKFKDRKNKIAAISACSNVTGIQTPVHQIAALIHEFGGLCFVDFAASAPYVNINMHPSKKNATLDAIYFSPHKFLGGPGTPGVLIFGKHIYTNKIPDQPGGGTVAYSNPWKDHRYVGDIEEREDGGTPPFLQAFRAAMCIRLKETMGVDNILRREKEILDNIFRRFAGIAKVKVLEGNIKKRLGIISFIVHGVHHDLFVKILNDRFGLQLRGGCSCAGTYGHILLGVSKKRSYEIERAISRGNMLVKPGWIRLSVHPTMTDKEINFIMDAIERAVSNLAQWAQDYDYDPESARYYVKGISTTDQHQIAQWFNPALRPAQI
jgi:selenocysteine lyase/cysteine desulfurase